MGTRQDGEKVAGVARLGQEVLGIGMRGGRQLYRKGIEMTKKDGCM